MADWKGFGQNFVRAIIGNAEGAFDSTNPLPVTSAGGDLPDGGTLVAGTKALDTNAAALGSQACVAVLVQADPDNTVDILIGTSASQPYQLAPGQAVSLPVSNVSQVYAKSVSATANANWLAVTV